MVSTAHVRTNIITFSISATSILMLSSHLQPGRPSGRFPTAFPTKIMFAFLLHPNLATCPEHRNPYISLHPNLATCPEHRNPYISLP
jgi:hypothetical protein